VDEARDFLIEDMLYCESCRKAMTLLPACGVSTVPAVAHRQRGAW
jgi:hypothetical protein